MRSTVRTTAALLCMFAVLPAPALATIPWKSVVADPASDQTHGDLWDDHPGLRASTDLRRAVFATESGKLRITWTYAATPRPARAFQSSGMSAGIGSKQITFVAWKRSNGTTYTSVSTGLGNDSKFYCAGKAKVTENRTAHTITLRVPVSCLPAGRKLASPYATGGVTVLRPSGVVKGYVGSDSTLPGPTFRIRAAS